MIIQVTAVLHFFINKLVRKIALFIETIQMFAQN